MSCFQKILSAKQIQKIDSYTIDNEPIKSIDLMERAALKITKCLCEEFNISTRFKIFAGPGNNGGDALAVARLLNERNYYVEVFLVKAKNLLSADCESNLQKLQRNERVPVTKIQSKDDFPVIAYSEIIVDGLFGSGLSRRLEGIFAETAQYINEQVAKVISIDIPSGLFDTDNTANDFRNIVHADYTLSLQFPKLAFFFPENEKTVGIWKILPIGLHPEGIDKAQTHFYCVKKRNIKPLIRKRSKFAHKGNFGHALLISGSFGKIGAAVLGAKACLRSGVGLLTIHLPGCGCQIMQTAVPEAMVVTDKNENIITERKDLTFFSAIGIGPGIGQRAETAAVLEKILRQVKVPLVLDADAINILGEKPELKKILPAKTILTPHPKEFERLVGEKSKNSLHRVELQQKFAKQHKTILIIKGAHTSIALPNGDCYFNTTGNPGMATAGSGDVLTGIILGLLAQSYTPEKAALMGVFIHGLAGDLACKQKGERGLIASDIVSFLPKAWKKILS